MSDLVITLYHSNTGPKKKMFISKKGEQLTNEHFFWDTWYTLLFTKVFLFQQMLDATFLKYESNGTMQLPPEVIVQ